MSNGTSRQAWSLIAVLLAATGCASTSEYAKFAQAGSAYASALDHVLIAAAQTSVDATSERLLQDDAVSNQDLKSYRSLSDVDEERLVTIGKLRAHTHLLAAYFRLLGDFANTDASARAEAAVGAVVDSLSSLGGQLRARRSALNQETLAGVTPLVVGAKVNAALKKELERRKETIRLELQTQEALLGELAAEIDHDVRVTRDAKEQRVVIAPLLEPKPIANASAWADNRRAILTSRSALDELANGKDAGTELRTTFEDLVSGKVTLGRIDALLASIDGLLSVAASLTR